MPPNKKKKKPASNPARGFATVSVPSRPKIVDLTAVSSTAESSLAASEGENSPPPTDIQQPVAGNDSKKTLQALSPEELERHFEQAELQSLVDKHAAKCKSEALRQVSKLETERRVLRPQANILGLNDWMPQDILDRVLTSAQTELDNRDPPSERDLDGSKEEELATRLWTLKETFQKLRFSQTRVEELLKYLVTYNSGFAGGSKDLSWVIDESLNWLALQCSPAELPPYDKKEAVFPKTEEAITSWINDSKERQSASASISSTPGKDDWKKSKAPPPLINDPEVVLDDSDSSIDPENFVDEYVSLQSRLYKIQPRLIDQLAKGAKRATRENRAQNESDPRAKSILRKLTKIENDVLFDRHEADVKWLDTLNHLRQEAAFVREKERTIETPSGPIQPSKDFGEDSGVVGDAPLETPISDDEGLFGEIFAGDISNGPSSILETPNSHHLLRDFGKPSGLSPRRVLEEVCKARDPASKVLFKDLSVSSYSNRKAIEIQWSKPQEEPLPITVERVTIQSNPFTLFASMDSIATSTSPQAEGYTSTLGLFLISSLNTKEGKAYLRLPAVWRELWAEFSEIKKREEDQADKAQFKYLRDLIQEHHGKFEHDVVLSENFKRRNGSSKKTEPPEISQDLGSHISTEKMTHLWKEKSSTSSFQKMAEFRKSLPVWAYKQEILDTLANNQTIIVCSETGSGKSTQIPSFIMENELANSRECKIYVTEPRRISAISLARRVSEELGEKPHEVGTNKSLVGYAIRLESKISQSTRLIFATTGVVVRMLERPSDFQDISHIVLDEVHERSIDSDFLLIVLRRLLAQRPDLRVVLMSATVDARRFSNYLNGAPVLNIPGRTFPVEVKYLEDAVHLTNHRIADQQSGSIIDDDEDSSSEGPRNDDATRSLRVSLEGYPQKTKETVLKFDEYRLDYRLITKLLVSIATKPELISYSRAILVFMPGLAEIRRLHDEIGADSMFNQGWILHTLHSSISSEDQEKAFLVPPEGTRKIVIATNIAETGITIPDITAVIDAGKEKVMR
ncbi:hypothetical protein BGW36DRAFT_178969 [Talaromyces proteolyticus]|uniref:RNA helicase n=1 Tax=Talaromyces proteolyticus TaxID=1131652 RepID=A0AAD4KTT6_9EURO|nr:uncharacterized protein BGW36DRAFT_178969 [Talaromyces proteolyticus]KAH8695954.1 hypothetical protein BGW36DRAFT_178969 [Talaromyces proteolyticus]